MHTQILPLAPPERQFWSPYSAQDANCGHTLLISLEGLVADGLLPTADLPAPVPFQEQADFAAVASLKEPLLRRAAGALLDGKGGAALGDEFAAFCETQAFWLEDAALFAVLCQHNAGAWWDWLPEVRDYEPAAMKEVAAEYAREVSEFKALQFLFNRQWMQVKQYANSKGISVVGDMVSTCSRRAGRGRGLTEKKKAHLRGRPQRRCLGQQGPLRGRLGGQAGFCERGPARRVQRHWATLGVGEYMRPPRREERRTD